MAREVKAGSARKVFNGQFGVLAKVKTDNGINKQKFPTINLAKSEGDVTPAMESIGFHRMFGKTNANLFRKLSGYGSNIMGIVKNSRKEAYTITPNNHNFFFADCFRMSGNDIKNATIPISNESIMEM